MQIKSESPDTPTLPKLSLLAKKDIRDGFNAALPELTKTINELLKATTTYYHVDIDFPQLFAHCVAADSNSGQNSIGTTARAYLDGFIDNLKKYTDVGEYEDAIQIFDSLVTERKITITADDTFTYEGCSIKNGVFEINYNTKSFGTNSSYACSYMAKEIDKALFAKSPYTLPLLARRGLRDEWSTQQETVTSSIKEELLGAQVKLMVNVELIWKLLVDAAKNSKQDIDLEYIAPNMGSTLYQYFSGFLSQIQYQFKKDELMVEGFTDEVTTGEIWVEVVPQDELELKTGYNECKVEDGKVILRTTPLNWGTNASYVAERLSHLL